MLPETHLTSYSRMSDSRWMIIPSWLSRSLRSFLYSTVCACHLFLISSTSFRSFIMPILSWNIPLIAPVFLKRSLVFPILFLYFVSLFIKEDLLILWNSAFSRVFYPFSIPFAYLLPSAICKASPHNHFACWYFFFFIFSMILATASCTTSPTSVQNGFLGTLSIRSNPLNLFVTSTIESSRILFRSYLDSVVVFPTFFNVHLNFAIRSSLSEPQSGPSLVFADCIELIHLQLQRI